MPNIASILKAEISRIARREVRAQTAGFKKSLAACRSEIADLKRRAAALESALRRAIKPGPKAPASAAGSDAVQTLRFSAKGFASQRRRLGLSAEDVGLLLGASGQTVYNWEHGTARPRAKHLPAIAAIRNLGKKQARAELASLRGKS